MNTFFSVVVLLAFMALFIFLMYKIVTNTVGKDTTTKETPHNDTPTAAQTAELESIKFAKGVSIVAVTPSKGSMMLRDVVMKASYNTAFTGNYVNLNMIKLVLSRGCRVLDFQVFVRNRVVVVGYSNSTYDPSYTSMTSLNCVSLAGVCKTIMANAFSDKSPNYKDPLFVQFHLKTALTEHYNTVANVLSDNMKEKLYWNASSNKAQQVDPNTKLEDLSDKIVVCIDAPELEKSTCDDEACKKLKNVNNMTIGSGTVPVYSEHELSMQMFASYKTPYLLRIVQPTLGFYGGVTNPDAKHLIHNYAAQIVCEAFYIQDANFEYYESLFDKGKCAFLSLSDTIGKLK